MTAWIGFDRMLKMSSFCIFWLVYLSLPVTVLILISTFKVLISHLFVQVWGTIIMQKRYKGMDYFLALLVTLGCSIFILFPVMTMLPVSATPFLMLFDI